MRPIDYICLVYSNVLNCANHALGVKLGHALMVCHKLPCSGGNFNHEANSFYI